MSTASHRHLLLMSIGTRALLEKVKDRLFANAPETLKCLCIPTAAYAEENHDWLYEELEEFRAFGFTLDLFDLKNKSAKDVTSALSNADVVYVTGGNTYVLLEHMKKCHFKTALETRLDQGAVYIGTSAGSVVTCPSIDFIEDMDDPSIANLTDYKGLNLVDFYIMPHIDGEYFKDAVKKIAAKSGQLDKPLWGLKDNQALLYHSNYVEILQAD